MTSPSNATRYQPWLRESASTVSPGVNTASSPPFPLRRFRTLVQVRATSSRPVSATAGDDGPLAAGAPGRLGSGGGAAESSRGVAARGADASGAEPSPGSARSAVAA